MLAVIDPAVMLIAPGGVFSPTIRQARRTRAGCASTSHPTTTRLATGPIIFCHHGFQRLNVQRLLSDNGFQPAVLVLELLEPLHLTQLHPAGEVPPLLGLRVSIDSRPRDHDVHAGRRRR